MKLQQRLLTTHRVFSSQPSPTFLVALLPSPTPSTTLSVYGLNLRAQAASYLASPFPLNAEVHACECIEMISDGTCRLCDGGAHGSPSNVFHNGACDDLHVDPGTHCGMLQRAGLHLSHHHRHYCSVQAVRHTGEYRENMKGHVTAHCNGGGVVGVKGVHARSVVFCLFK